VLLDVRPEWHGRKIECGGCGFVFDVPENLPKAVVWDDRDAGRPRYSRRTGRRLRPLPEPPDDTDGTTQSRLQPGQGAAVTGMVLGIVALVVGVPSSACFCPLILTVLSVLALLFGFIGLRTEGRQMAMAGLVMGAIGQVIAGIFILFYGKIMNDFLTRIAPPPPAPIAAPLPAPPGGFAPGPGGVKK
jgi:hypothetical protein